MNTTEPRETRILDGLPILPLKSAVLFPHQLQPIVAGRPATVAAIDAALASEGKQILVVAQHDPSVESPEQSDLQTVGTLATVAKAARLPNGAVQALVRGTERAILLRVEKTEPWLAARVRLAPVEPSSEKEVEALHRENQDLLKKVIELGSAQVSIEPDEWLEMQRDPAHAAYLFASLVDLPSEKEQEVLDADDVRELLYVVHRHLSHELRVLELRNEISSKAQSEMNDEQREYMLRKQLRAIQQELGEKDGASSDLTDLRESLEKTELPEAVRKEAERELRRLEAINPASPEHGVVRSYLEFLLELPWSRSTESRVDVNEARKILDEDHFGLEEVKERILEHLGVLQLNPSANAPILCFVGPPGVGKTSLGRSIARSLHREFERMSLGGLSDEAELRGHRRTYIGAMPGRVLQALRRAGVSNPVILLDEVDKLGRDYRGDPAAALLEILDPEQNREFRDNYLDQPFDLSKVLFILTANDLDTIPAPLRDRLEIIRFAGYSEEEKLEIARRYLIPAKTREVGLSLDRLRVDDEAVRAVISGHTREAGVRELERTIGKIARKLALRVVQDASADTHVRVEDLRGLLGPERFFLERSRAELEVGVAQGLAWTPVGGEVLYIETSLLPEGSGLTLTGQLGDVMKESATTAKSHVWTHARELGVDAARVKESGVHVHVPAGAIPKDGPSAGITIATALTSLYTGRKVRRDTAMTGEVTLTGLVLPVGGVKEKVLAARRAGVHRVILSRENEKDLHDLPDYVKADMEFVLVGRLGEVLEAALEPQRPCKGLRRVG